MPCPDRHVPTSIRPFPRISVLVLVALLAATTAIASAREGPSPAQPGATTGGGVISGTVLVDDHTPLVGAQVELIPVLGNFANARLRLDGTADPEAAALTTSDENGRFSLAAPKAGVYAVALRAAGRLPLRHLPRVIGNGAELPPVLVPSARPFRVQVVDGTGHPVSGAQVLAESAGTSGAALSVWLPSLRRGRTDSDGRTKLPRADGESLDLTVVTAGGTLVQRAGVEADEALVQVQPGDRHLHRLRVVEPGGKPLEGVIARLGRAAWPVARSDSEGRLDLPASYEESNDPGPLDLLLVAVDGRSTRLQLAATPASDGRTAAVEPRRDVTLPAAHTVAGRVIDPDGAPVAGAVVWPIADPGTFALTDKNGRWSSALIAAGPYEVQVEAAGHAPVRLHVGATHLARGNAPALTLPHLAAVSGVVTDPYGTPLVDARLAAVPRGGRRHFAVDPADDRTLSDRGGAFALSRLRPGAAYDVVATAPDRTTVSLSATAPRAGGTPPHLHLVLPPLTAAHGRVLDTADRAVAGAKVEILPHGAALRAAPKVAQGREIDPRTDENGHFRLAALPAAQIDVRVTADGFAPLLVRRIEAATLPISQPAVDAGISATGAPVRDPLDLDLGTFVLVVGGTITGVVSDATGSPVEGAEIHVADEDLGQRLRRRPDRSRVLDRREAMVRSDAAGVFHVDDLPPGARRTLFVRARRHLPARLDGVVVGGDPVAVTLQPAAAVIGRVVDGEGRPVAEAEIHLAWRDTLADAPERRLPSGTRMVRSSDEDGRFEFDRVRPGSAMVTISVEGRVDPEPQQVTAELDTVTELLFVASRGAVLHGFVYDSDDEPVEGAHVIATGAGTVTDAEGAYLLAGVQTGEGVKVRVRHPVHGRYEEHLDLSAGDNRHDWEIPVAAVVSGRVTAREDEDPIAGAEVQLTGSDGVPTFQATTDGDGVFEFPRVPAGTYTLTATAQGYAAGRGDEPLEVGDEDVDELGLALEPAASITGRVLGLAFEEIARVHVRARQGTVRHEARLDHRGEFALRDLSYGTWQVEAALDRDRRQVARRVVVDRDRRQAEVELEFGDGLTLRGQVILDHEPLSGASISLRGESVAVERSLLSDHDGEFIARDLPAGRYRLGVRHPLHVAMHNELLHLVGDHRLLIDLKTSSLQGRVLAAADGTPLANAYVALRRAGEAQGLVLHVTDVDGEFHVDEIAAGSYDLRVTHEGHTPSEQPLEVAPGGGETALEVVLEAADVLPLVVRLADGRIPPGVLALVRAPGGTAVVAEHYPVAGDGSVEIQAPAGRWQLLLSTPGGSLVDLQVSVPTDVAVPVVLPVGGRLDVRIPELADSMRIGIVRVVSVDGTPHRVLDLGRRSTVDTWSLTDAGAVVPGVPAGAWTVIATVGERTWQAPLVTGGGDTVIVLGAPSPGRDEGGDDRREALEADPLDASARETGLRSGESVPGA